MLSTCFAKMLTDITTTRNILGKEKKERKKYVAALVFQISESKIQLQLEVKHFSYSQPNLSHLFWIPLNNELSPMNISCILHCFLPGKYSLWPPIIYGLFPSKNMETLFKHFMHRFATQESHKKRSNHYASRSVGPMFVLNLSKMLFMARS